MGQSKDHPVCKVLRQMLYLTKEPPLLKGIGSTFDIGKSVCQLFNVHRFPQDSASVLFF